MSAIRQAADLAGGPTALAARLGVKVTRVQMWLARGQVPPEFCRRIEAALEGRLTRYELRPDVFGTAPDAPHREAA